ncbi:MAG: c-type cytochrome [Burkholderiales bacterium]
MYRFAAGVVAMLIVSATVLAADDPGKAREIVKQNCAACHGADGNSPLPANPSLAGQHADYLLKQMREFKSGIRGNPVMMGMLANLSDSDLRALAGYFASQNPKASSARDKDGALMGQGIYRGGIAAKSVAACAGCHAPDGSGIPAQYPRLAGQQTEYVVAQLKAFRAEGRVNDLNEMMRSVAANLNDKEISALAEYISGLR